MMQRARERKPKVSFPGVKEEPLPMSFGQCCSLSVSG